MRVAAPAGGSVRHQGKRCDRNGSPRESSRTHHAGVQDQLGIRRERAVPCCNALFVADVGKHGPCGDVNYAQTLCLEKRAERRRRLSVNESRQSTGVSAVERTDEVLCTYGRKERLG